MRLAGWVSCGRGQFVIIVTRREQLIRFTLFVTIIRGADHFTRW